MHEPAPATPPGPTAAVSRNGDPPDPGALAARLDAAWARFAEVADRMEAAAAAMRRDGLPPDHRLIEALGDCHREFLRVRRLWLTDRAARGLPAPPDDATTSLSRLGPGPDAPAPALEPLVATIGLPPDRPVSVAPAEAPPAPPVDSAADASPQLFAVDPFPTPDATAPPLPDLVAPPLDATIGPVPDPETPAEGPVRGAAVAVLDAFLRIRPGDGQALPDLLACQSRACSLRDALRSAPTGALPPEAPALASGEHPFARLVTALANPEGLSDAAWADLHALVAESLGRPIAVALARRRLTLGPAD